MHTIAYTAAQIEAVFLYWCPAVQVTWSIFVLPSPFKMNSYRIHAVVTYFHCVLSVEGPG